MTARTSPIRLHKALTRIWATGPGWQWLAAVNHSVVGLRFMITAAVFFAIGGMLAMLIRAQLATPGSAFLGPDIYNQIFTMHGTIMMFLFAIPMLEGLALYMLPKMLGARDLAFPRLSAYGYWCYLFGGMILIGALLAGAAPRDGWFMYTPLSSDIYSPGINADVWLLGVTFVEISALTMAVELTVSIQVSEVLTSDILDGFASAPRLATAILWAASRDEAMVVEHLVSIGRRSADERGACEPRAAPPARRGVGDVPEGTGRFQRFTPVDPARRIRSRLSGSGRAIAALGPVASVRKHPPRP